MNSFEDPRTEDVDDTSESSTHTILLDSPSSDRAAQRNHGTKHTPRQGRQVHGDSTLRDATRGGTHPHARGRSNQRHAIRSSWRQFLAAAIVAVSARSTRSRQTPLTFPLPGLSCHPHHTHPSLSLRIHESRRTRAKQGGGT